MGGKSIFRALAAASTGSGKELNWPPLTLPVLLWLVLLPQPQQEKSKGLEGGGVQWRLPLFLTLVRKPSVLLRGEWHLLITIEALWEVPPSTLWQRFAPVLQ